MSVQETILIKVDSNANNNKFYKVVLHEGFNHSLQTIKNDKI